MILLFVVLLQINFDDYSSVAISSTRASQTTTYQDYDGVVATDLSMPSP
jgi:hypothetical protein